MRRKKRKKKEHYRDRLKALLLLGFPSYWDYLESDLWKIIRKSIFARDNYRCIVPGCRVHGHIQAHHLSYKLDVLCGLDPSRIVTLCSDHHKIVEFTKAGRKLSLSRVVSKTTELLGRGRILLRQQEIAKRVILVLRQSAYYTKVSGLIKSGKVSRYYRSFLEN